MPGPTFTELPILGVLASSHPFHSQLLCNLLSSPHHYNDLKWPLGFKDFSLSISSFTSATFVPSLFPSSSPPRCCTLTLSSCGFDISVEDFLSSFFPLQLARTFPFLSDLILSLQFIYPVSDDNLFNSISSFWFFLLNFGLATCWHSQLSHLMAHQHQSPQGQSQTLSSQTFLMSTKKTNGSFSEPGLQFTPLPLSKCPNF